MCVCECECVCGCGCGSSSDSDSDSHKWHWIEGAQTRPGRAVAEAFGVGRESRATHGLDEVL